MSSQLCVTCSRASKPLLEAAGAGHANCIVQCLKVRGRFDSSIRDDFGATAVHLAARKGRLEALRYLVEYGEAVEPLRANNGASPAHDAAATGNLGCLRYLVAHTACSAHDRDNKRATPIHWAAQMGHLSVVQWLVEEAGAPLDVKTKSGVTPIHFATAKNQLEVLKYLTSLNVPNMKELVNARAGNGATPVYFASQDGHLRCVAWLVEKACCDCHITANDGMTCLHAAAQEGHLDCVRYLVTTGCMSVRTESADGTTPAHFAAAQGHLHILQWLIVSGGASGCERDNYGGTPAHDAAEQGQLQVLQFLYQQEIDINIKDNDGNTPTVLAERNEQRECCEFLIHAAKKQEEMKRIQLLENIQPRRDRSQRGSTKSIRLQDWVEETRQEEESRQLERKGSNRSTGGSGARSPVSPEPHLLDADARKQWEELQRLIAEEERQTRQLGSSNQRRWAEKEQLRIADAARERQKRRELEASLRTARIEVERSEKRLREEQEFLTQRGELFETEKPMSAAELSKWKEDEEKRRQYRKLREAEEETLQKQRRAEQKMKREALEKQLAEEERQRILTERQQQWMHGMQKQNEEHRRTQEQENEERRKIEEQEKKKREEEKAKERKKQQEMERKKYKKEEEQRRKRQKKEEKEREKSQKERQKYMKKLEKERRQNWDIQLAEDDLMNQSDHEPSEIDVMRLSRSNTVSKSEQLRVKGLVSLRTKQFERRHSENIRHTEKQSRGVFKWILGSSSKQGKPNVVLAKQPNSSVPVPPPVPKELGSATPSPALTPSVSTEKISSRKPSSRTSSSRRSSIVEFLFPSKESKERKSSPSTPRNQLGAHSHSCSDTPETSSPAHSQTHSRTSSLPDVREVVAAHAPVERKTPELTLPSNKSTNKSLKEALSAHSQMEKSFGVSSQSTAKSLEEQTHADSLQHPRLSADLEKEQASSNTSPKRKAPSLQDALASSRSSMEKLSPKTSLNTLDLLTVKDSSPAAMMAALERALAASPSQPRAVFQTTVDSMSSTGDPDKRDLMLELAKSAKSGQARHFDDNESEDAPPFIHNQTHMLVPPISSPTRSLEPTTAELDSVYHDVPAPPPVPDMSGSGSGRHSTLETIEEDDEPEEVEEEQLDHAKLKKYAQLLDSFEINRRRALLSRVLETWLALRNTRLAARAIQQRANSSNNRRLLQRTFTAWCKYCGVVDEGIGKHESDRSNAVLALNEKTFLEWLNVRLAQVNQKVNNLESAIASGVPILTALHVASRVTMPKHVAKPRFRVQYQDNWATVINFMQQLGIPTNNLNSEDLYRQKQNAIHKLLANIVSWSQTSR